MKLKWNDGHIIDFLEAYRKYGALWDSSCPEYRNGTARERASVGMVEDLSLEGLTVEDVKSKIKSIRSRYGAELGKIRRSERSGAGVQDVYKPRLFWFAQADTFLRTVIQPRDSSSNLPVSSNDATNEQAIVTSSGRSRSPFVRVRSEESLRFY